MQAALSAFRSAMRAPIKRAAPRAVLPSSSTLLQTRCFACSARSQVTLNQSMRNKDRSKKPQPRSPALQGAPQRKGVCAKVFMVKPRKPNSANRRVARVKLTNGRTVVAHIPGEGHNLQEHSVVLVTGGRAKDLPGVKSVSIAYESNAKCSRQIPACKRSPGFGRSSRSQVKSISLRHQETQELEIRWSAKEGIKDARIKLPSAVQKGEENFALSKTQFTTENWPDALAP